MFLIYYKKSLKQDHIGNKLDRFVHNIMEENRSKQDRFADDAMKKNDSKLNKCMFVSSMKRVLFSDLLLMNTDNKSKDTCCIFKYMYVKSGLNNSM